MIDLPETWQYRQLLAVIEKSPLAEEGFRFSKVSQGGHFNTAFRVTHEGYPEAAFFSEWMDLRDPTGYSGKPKGDWHVEMSPGSDSPYEKHNYVAWSHVINHFTRWVGFLAREFEATEDWGHFVQLPRLPLAGPPSDSHFDQSEIDVIEPLLLRGEAELVQVVETELATREDLDDLREYIQAEFADVRAELRKQSKRAFRRTLFGMAANLAMKFGPIVWKSMVPMFEELVRLFDSIRALPSP